MKKKSKKKNLSKKQIQTRIIDKTNVEVEIEITDNLRYGGNLILTGNNFFVEKVDKGKQKVDNLDELQIVDYDKFGFNKQGFHINRTRYDEKGVDVDGFKRDGTTGVFKLTGSPDTKDSSA